jgi:hypothetical protein
MDNNEYSRLPPTTYVLPAPKGLFEGATGNVRDVMKDAYKQAMDTFVEAHVFKTHLKALLIKAVPSLYINDFDDSGICASNAGKLLTHLVESYERITARELEKNLSRIAASWNPDTPLEKVFANGASCGKFAVTADTYAS